MAHPPHVPWDTVGGERAGSLRREDEARDPEDVCDISSMG